MSPWLLYAGIDEAGFGPLLGPMCVGLAAFAVREDALGEAGQAPDLWDSLGPIVARHRTRASQGVIPVADSKRLKLANNAKQHPLTYLERGVLSFLASAGEAVADTGGLWEALRIARVEGGGGCPWSSGSTALPLATTGDHISMLGAQLRRAQVRSGVGAGDGSGAGVVFLGLRVAVIEPPALNARIRSGIGKGAVSLGMSQHLARSAASELTEVDGEAIAGPARIVIDRQGGRQRYAEAIEGCPAGGEVTRVIGERPERSVYEVAFPGVDRPVRMSFEVEAEDRHLPVALASMAAKYVRELMMARFNEYWALRNPEIKPTAGYTTDGRRWLAEMGTHLSKEERAQLIRIS